MAQASAEQTMTTATATEPTNVVALDQAREPARFGHKAATLATLRASGHRVPDGLVVPVGDAVSRDELAAALSRLGSGPFAVRSSGVAEDLDDASFAGQYETVLGVEGLDNVLAAIARVRASGDEGHVAAARRFAGLPDAPVAVAVLIQPMVPADAAGVAFSMNPVTGDDEAVVEAVRGLGDRLVCGEATGDRWVDRGGGVEALNDTGVLSAALAGEVAALVRRVARERGAPQDIEWALAKGELHLLQARPITGLPVAPAIVVPPGRWQKDTGHFTGPLTPVGASILLPAYERAVAAMCLGFGLPLETLRQRSFGGEVYTQEVELGGGTSTSAPPPWWVLAIVSRILPPMRRCMKAAAAAIPKLEELPRLWETTLRDECLARIDAAREIDLSALDDDALLRELDRLVDEVLQLHLDLHFELMMPSVVGTHELFAVCEESLGWDLARTMDLLDGLSTTTTRPVREMAEIAAESGPEAIARGLEAVRTGPAGPRLVSWLERWGLRTIDVDPGTPCIAERDDLVLELLRTARDDRAALKKRRETSLAEARGTLTAQARGRFETALRYAERVYPLREDNVPLTEGFPAGLVRRCLMEVGRRLASAKVLRRAEDVMYLERREIASALSGALTGEPPHERARRRRAEQAWVLAHPGPMTHGPAPVPPPDVRGLPAPARRLMRAVLWAMELELAPPQAQSEHGDTLVGIGAAPGTYTGRVRIIRTEADLGRLEPGEVLVCRTTHSSWSVVFARAGALVADGGGLLSHPAIIAREHAIPAVLGTVRATHVLRDGQTVTVDGVKGHVRIH